MKHVTFTRDMKPHRAGEQRLVPDELAASLEREGAVEPGAPDWPESAKPSAPSAPPQQKPERRPDRQRYKTK